jgi:hypothetical protein
MKYASGTTVSEARTKAEIQYLLEKFGADQFGYATDRNSRMAELGFRYKGANFRFQLPLAGPDDEAIKLTPTGRTRTHGRALEILLQDENRRRWRSLCVVLKAMLVGVEDGILSFGEIFMPYMVWGDGRTTAQTLLPGIEKLLQGGGVLPKLSTQHLLPGKEEV